MRVLLNSRAALAVAVAAVVGLAAPAGAQEGERVQRVPLDQVQYIGDEPIHLTGEFVSFERFTTDVSGGTHLVLHVNTTGVRGVTADGTTYRGTQTETLAAYSPPGEGQALTHTLSFVLTGPGRDNQIHLHTDAHITVTPNGEVVVSFDHFVVN